MAISLSSSYLLTLFLTITAAVLRLPTPTHSATHHSDVQLLKQLKRTIAPSTIPPGSCIDSWDFTLDPCDNLFSDKFTCGLRCNSSSAAAAARVTELSLDPAGYSGSLAAVPWAAAPYLQILDLSDNNFSGPIPDSLSALTRLRRLGLSGNSLSGPIPDSLGSLAGLEEMCLDRNNLTGTVPSSLNGLANLKRLEIQGNRLGAEFPDLSRLGELSFLDASDNAISGGIPAALPPSLVEIAMRNNQLQGNIPAGLVANSAFLQVMDLSHNKLAGSIPASLFAHPSLEQLTLSYNQFGSIETPGDSVLGSQLISVDLSNNQIHGFLPGFMGQMTRLSALSLENNQFSGLIPTQYVLKVLGHGAAQFERLLLGGNYLYGPIPGEFLGLKAGSVMVQLGDNCLYRCPVRWFFCEGGEQKSLNECRAFGPIIP
ncbi:leucine-rich repeat receptor-like protein kinase family protein [Striga asiatica]|uniref:Leucine-rich repeat receptor-like protein kinase family protein n=1 Tax=Striga asiatica TaxID=4170 RepID=A0A5A7Q576_STRAF|nr:leucine-rich repeat receptor-like protein kinase family protein [Striga asiatica]